MSLTFSRTQGNGVTVNYPIVAESGYFEDEDIVVELIEIESGTVVPQILDSHYTISDGNVVFNNAPANVYYVMVRRDADYETTQSDFQRGSAFGPDSINRAFLKGLYQIQKLADGFNSDGYYWKTDINGGGKRLTNIANGVEDSDAVTLGQLSEQILDVVISEGGVSQETLDMIAQAVQEAQEAAEDAQHAADIAAAAASNISIWNPISENLWLKEYVDPGVILPALTTNDPSIVAEYISEDKGQPSGSVQVLQISNTGSLTDGYVWLSEGSTDYNVPIPAGYSFIISFYARSSINTSMNEAYVSNNADPSLQGIPMDNLVAGVWKRFSYVMPYTYGATFMNLRIDNDTPNSILWIDGIQIEKVVGGVTEPGDYQPPQQVFDEGDATLPTINLSILGIQGWQTTITFSSTDINTVSWTSGNLLFQSGRTFPINAGNTGNMASMTYIYFDYEISINTLLTTTTPAAAVGQNRVCICVANPSVAPEVEATFAMFGGSGKVLITKDSIAANTITANEIAANTITASQINTGSITIGTLGGAGTFTAYDTSRVNGTAASIVAANAAAGATFTSSSLLDYTKVSGTKPPSNADKTSLNTALDTTYINGMASGTLISGGFIGTGLVVANSIVSAAVTAAKLHVDALSTCKLYVTPTNATAYDVYHAYISCNSVNTVALGVVHTTTTSGIYVGVYGKSDSSGTSAIGVQGSCDNGSGVHGGSLTGYGVQGRSTSKPGVYGTSVNSWGVQGHSDTTYGLGTHKSCYAALGYAPFTGSHLCITKQSLIVGDIVQADGSVLESIDQAYPKVSVSTSTKDKKVIGVVSECEVCELKDSILLAHLKDDENYYQANPIDEEDFIYPEDDVHKGKKKGDVEKVNKGSEYILKGENKDKPLSSLLNTLGWRAAKINSLGEGGINVCSEGGDIEIGDYICTSSIPGKGMKQDDDLLHNYTVAKALESVVWKGKGKKDEVRMIACTYHCG